ncbi:MAG: hypothetical protein ACLR23_00485 [Clostridia bacterium]
MARDNERSRRCCERRIPPKAYTHKHHRYYPSYESLGPNQCTLGWRVAVDVAQGGRFRTAAWHLDLLNDAAAEQALEEKKEEQDGRSTLYDVIRRDCDSRYIRWRAELRTRFC